VASAGTTAAAASPPPDTAAAAGGATADGYARGARILSIGIASTGLFTFAYFAVASHVLPSGDYGAISLLWSVLFVVISIIYRPVEQLLSRTIADRRARGLAGGHPLRVPLTVQGGFALAFLVLALALRGPIEDAFGSSTLYWVFVGATLAYAASYFARGYFAGHQWFGLYGGLVLFESISRFCFPVAVAVGLASGQAAVALGILAAPLASLLVVPWALRRHAAMGRGAVTAADARRLTLRAGAGFALSVAAIQLAEQALLNAAVLTVGATATAALAGVVFNALLITRAPLQLFQSVQTSLLPHLSGLEATEGGEAFGKAIRITILAIVGFAGAVAVGLLLVGPPVMNVVFGSDYSYGRLGLAVIALGMGLHLCAGTLNQAALARGRDRAAAAAWLVAAAVFVAWMLTPVVDDELVRAEVGYAGAAALLCAMLAALYAQGRSGRVVLRRDAPAERG
jgi:O-antigen/teichoic acid export membrane protein